MSGVLGRRVSRLVVAQRAHHRSVCPRNILLVPAMCYSSKKDPKKMTAQDWQKQLSSEQYFVTREGGTEPPFSGVYYNHHEEGVYQCVCCGLDLFSSKAKYESGSGWPSFHTAEGKEESNVATRTDTSHMMLRTEVLCKECSAHLGHVFPDGPEPSGLRYCINSLSLKFSHKKQS